jgi:hypothetical protein
MLLTTAKTFPQLTLIHNRNRLNPRTAETQEKGFGHVDTHKCVKPSGDLAMLERFGAGRYQSRAATLANAEARRG